MKFCDICGEKDETVVKMDISKYGPLQWPTINVCYSCAKVSKLDLVKVKDENN